MAELVPTKELSLLLRSIEGEMDIFCPASGTHPCPVRGWRFGIGLGTLLQSCCITPHVAVCWEASVGVTCDWVPPLVLIDVDTLHICLGEDVICAAGQTWQRQERGYSQGLRSSRADKYPFTLTKLALHLCPRACWFCLSSPDAIMTHR
jgi:hypothetical protein